MSRTVRTNGISMYAVAGGEGRSIVFLHGLGWDHALWTSGLSRYGRSYRVIAADSRGHGATDKPAGPYYLAQFKADWLGLLDALSVPVACLIGLSQGAMVAMLLAIEEPSRVGALVLVSTACRSDRARRAEMEARITSARRDGPVAAARLAAASIFGPAFVAEHAANVEEFVKRRASADQEPLFEAMRAGFDFDFRESLATLRVPTLVMSGHDDRLTPPGVVREVADHIAGARFESVESAGHMVPVEQPEVFHRCVDTFLSAEFPPKGA
jgi:pimeloyl-ACP methyl ester carboxylesterase